MSGTNSTTFGTMFVQVVQCLEEGREDTEDDKRIESLTISTTEEYMKKLRKLCSVLTKSL